MLPACAETASVEVGLTATFIECQGGDGQIASPCQISQLSVIPLPRYRDFQDGGSQPSWICLARICTADEKYLVVFISVQNLIAIDVAVSIVRMFHYLVVYVWLENANLRPQNWGFQRI